MKILDHGTKMKKEIKPYVDNPNISVRWNAEDQLLEISTVDNLNRHFTGESEKRRFNCVVQLSLDELREILSCLGSDVVSQSRELLSYSLSHSSRDLLRLLLTSTGLFDPSAKSLL